MSFFNTIKSRAKSNIKKIILPETDDERILKAGIIATKEEFAEIIFVGDEEKVKEDIRKVQAEDERYLLDKNIKIYNHNDLELKQHLANEFFLLRQHKGISFDEAYKMLDNKTYYAMMLLKCGFADGLVAGAINSTAETLRPALQIIKANEDSKFVSSFFLMELSDKNFGQNGVFLFADAALIEEPDEAQLAEIAIQSAKTFESFLLCEPKVAMLSYSTKGSASSNLTEKVINATNIAKEKNPRLLIDGELQLDAAIIPEIANIKAKDSVLEGKANVLIFPDINSGNIGYKLVQRLAGANAYGPLCQGLNKPINDLSRGSTINDILGVIAITAIQAQENI